MNNEVKGIIPIHEVKKNKLLKNWNSGHYNFVPNGGWIFSELNEFNFKNFPKKINTLINVYGLPEIDKFGVSYTTSLYRVEKTLLVDLDKDISDIWEKSVSSKRRNMVRKAQKEGVEVIIAKQERDLDAFFKLYTESSQRLKLSILPKDFFIDLFFNTVNIKLDFLQAYKGEELLSSIAVISDKNYSYYWLGNNRIDVMNFGQGELLQWEAIKLMKEKGCNIYDLCFIDPIKLPHLYLFKKGFSTTEVSVPVIQYKSLYYKILNKLFHD